MKKYLSIILICCMALSLLAGCGSSNASDSSAAGESPAAEAGRRRAVEWMRGPEISKVYLDTYRHRRRVTDSRSACRRDRRGRIPRAGYDVRA